MSAAATSELTRVLAELQRLERELLERGYLRHSDGTERVREALRRLGEVGSPAGIIDRSAEELGTSSDFDIVLLSRVEAEQIRPHALWSREGPEHTARAWAELSRRSIPLRYPLIEAEVAQRHQPMIVSVPASGGRAAPDLVAATLWHSYAVATIMLEGNVAGLLHAGRLGGGIETDEIDLELTARYAEGLAQVFERSMLHEQLQRQRAQLASAAEWINAQMLEISAQQAVHASAAITSPDVGEIADVLTPRELEVMRLIAQGHSNRAIATSLLLGEGTVKYHVKNILRKLQARSRTEAISRYVRLYGEGAS